MRLRQKWSSVKMRRDREKAMFAKRNQTNSRRTPRSRNTSVPGMSTANVVPEYNRPGYKEITDKKAKTYLSNGVFNASTGELEKAKKISRNMWVIGSPYKEKYRGTYTTRVLVKNKNGYYEFEVPTDKSGKIPERVAAARLLDTFDGDREKHHRSVFLDVGINAEKRWDQMDKANTYRWFVHPNESDIKFTDDKNTKILEILKQNKSGRRFILLSGGTEQQRDAVGQSIEKNFTVAEKRIIAGNLITIGHTPPGVAGYYSQQTDRYHNPVGCAEIRINTSCASENDSSVVIHECIHLLRDHDVKRDPHLRAVKNYRGRDADLEESMTEAETVSRERPMHKHESGTGYYQHIKSKDKSASGLILDDRVVINASALKKSKYNDLTPEEKKKVLIRGKKGKTSQKAVLKHYPKTNISKLKNKGNAEAIDSYYKLENRKGQPDANDVDVHVQTYAPEGNISQERKEDTAMKKSAQSVSKWEDKKLKKIK